MSEKVSEWLNGLGLGQYSAVFEENAVEVHILPDLTDTDLKELGISALGHRKLILKSVSTFQPEQSTTLSEVDKQAIGDPPTHPSTDEDIAVWTRTPDERKPVTILFADIVGSTALTEKLDAEDAHDLLYRATQNMCQAVENNKGTVCRFMGDGIMAMFGAPVASERHALEACHAALDMQISIGEYADELKVSHDHRIQIRVGLHSGEVVVLEVGDDPAKPEYDASGPTVPLAARMEQSAEAETILITATTRALAGDLIETKDQPSVTAKGVSEPIIVHQLRKVRSAAESSDVGTRHPFVGRRVELAQFRSLLDECLESGHGQTVYVRGEVGIGKSRLAEEMTLIAQESGFVCHKALVLDFGAGKGQEAVPTLVRSLLGITQGSGKVERESALERAESEDTTSAEYRTYLYDLLDLTQPLELRALYDAMDAQARSTGKRAALSELLIKLATGKRLLVVVEDLHWADDITLEYLASLTVSVAECSALMVMTSRAEGDPIDRAWRALAGESPIITWDLSPLRKEESVKMVSSFIDATETFAKRCIERAAGNPLFLEQLLLSVEKGASESVPDSIKSLVLARMDQLPGEDKQALQAAAVLGQRFDLEGLRFLIDKPNYGCQGLIEHNLVRPEGPLYLFVHTLFQEGAYNSLLKRQRTGLHRLAAEWYAERDPAIYAEHLDHAGDALASNAYLTAAQEQFGQYHPRRALQLVRRGLEIASDSERFAINYLEGELLRSLSSTTESIDAYRRASEVAGNDIERCRAWMGLAQGLGVIEAHEELFEVLKNAEAIAKAHALTSEIALIYQIRGSIHFNRGESEACLEAHTESLKYAREANSAEVETQALSGLGDAEYDRGHFISAHHYFDQCIEISRVQGFARVIAANLPMRGNMSRWRNDFESAAADFREGLELSEKTSQVRAEMVALLGGRLWADIGDFIEADKWFRRGVALTSRLGWKYNEASFLSELGRLAAQKGERLEACKLARESFDMLRGNESGMALMGPSVLGVLARVVEDPDQRQSALEEAETLLATGTKSRNLVFYEDAMETCLQAAEWDEVDRYAQALKDCTRAEPLPRCELFIARGRALAAHGRGNHDPGTIAELQRLHDESKRIGIKLILPALEEALSFT